MELLVNGQPDICDITINAQKKYEKHILTAPRVKFKKKERI